MKLYHSPLSPYVRKVMMTAHETGLVDRIETVEGTGTPMAPNDDVVSLNPVGKIPCLVTDDGQAIYDSRVITRYLNDLAGASLYGTGQAMFGILTREALAEGMIDAMLLAAYEARLRPEEIRYAPWVEAQRAKALRGAVAFDAIVGGYGETLTADQIALGAALGYADVRHPDLGWREAAPKAAAWYATFAERPSMQATWPPKV